MMILFVVLSFVMVFILIWQQIQHKKLVREIDYITSRLDTISVISENGFVLIQHLRMVLFFYLDICQQFSYATVTKGEYIIIVCS